MKRYMKNLAIVLIANLPFMLASQPSSSALLQSGPMLGYADMREALIWVQTKENAEVYAVYSDKENPAIHYSTARVSTIKEQAYTARLIADSVEPGHHYAYKLFINDIQVSLPYPTFFITAPIWKWRGNAPDFTMITGSCAYINQGEYDRSGNPYGGDYQIFRHMSTQKADLMLWLGDNTYLREPDWNSWTGIIKRNTHTRSLPELQPFLASTHHYAIWDDHDYGPDNSNKAFFNKSQTLNAFKYFWGNPTFGTPELEGAVTSFQWADADFFLLDNRWYRDPDELIIENKTILGTRQLNWLLENLITSKAVFKIVAMGGQFLSDVPTTSELYSANGFEKERELIINFIQTNNIHNVVFLTGDVHFTEGSVLKAPGKPAIYDFTFSPITSGPNTSGQSWKNSYRIPGTVVMERNFGMLRFSGENKARKLTVSCINSNNIKMWEYEVNQE